MRGPDDKPAPDDDDLVALAIDAAPYDDPNQRKSPPPSPRRAPSLTASSRPNPPSSERSAQLGVGVADGWRMNTVTDRQRERILEASSDTSAETPSAPAPTRAVARGISDASLEQTIDRLPVSPDYSAFLASFQNTSATASPSPSPNQGTTAHATLVSPTRGKAGDAAIQDRLDAFRNSFSGPYNVRGASVIAPPMFRMNTTTAFNAASAKSHAPALAEICKKAGISADLGPVSVGRGTPAQLKRVTQALIDAGELPPADAQHPTLADRIKGMQWEWGIGVDCAGYTQQAAAAAHPQAAGAYLKDPYGDVFSNMKKDARFENIDPSAIRPGDVLHLDPLKRGEVGHNVVAHSNTTLDDASRAKLAATPGLTVAAQAFLMGMGPFHAIEVDSSWGAGNGSTTGGFRRDTWIYDESTKTWGSFPSGDQRLPLQVADSGGPQGEVFGGAFRPKEKQ